MIEHFAETLFRESIHLRNRIAAREMAFGDGAIASVTEELSTDLLNELQVSNRLWNDFQEPQIAGNNQYAETLYATGTGLLPAVLHLCIERADTKQNGRKE